MRTCHCTNQCPGCGSCCQIDCGCRRTAHGWRVSPQPHTTPLPAVPVPNQRDLDIRIVPRTPLTEEGLRRILKEAFAEALSELRDVKGEGPEDQRA